VKIVGIIISMYSVSVFFSSFVFFWVCMLCVCVCVCIIFPCVPGVGG